MIIFNGLEEINNIEATAVALGNFDGFHKGHQTLLNECLKIAKEKGLKSSVFTFANHPANVIAGKTVVKRVMSFEEKAEYLENAGFDYMFNIPFDENIMTISPENFVRDILSSRLRAGHVVCGFNYSFGFKAGGRPELLKSLGNELGMGVSVMDEVVINGKIVSSTLLRGLIDEGRLDEYPLFTGRLYKIQGRVIKGNQLGKGLGFPTANLSLNDDEALPASGVYITNTYVNNKKYGSVTNVGNKPTVGNYEKNAETHIFGLDEDLYERELTVEFIRMTRPEIKFASFNELKAQIARDSANAREHHEREGLL